MWIGLLHHVTGKHEMPLDACQHGPLEEDRKGVDREGVHEVLAEIILSDRCLKEVHKYLHFRYDCEFIFL